MWRSACPSHIVAAAKKTAICSRCGYRCRSRYDRKTLRVRDLSVAGWRIYIEFERWRVQCPRCQSVHVEQLDWMAKNPRYTQRFAIHVGSLCRDMTVSRVAELERLHHSTVKDLDKMYMSRQIELAETPAPRAIGVDEISIRKGHNYRVIVSDLDKRRPIWVGGEGRKEEDLDKFYEFIGKNEEQKYQTGSHGYVESIQKFDFEPFT